MRKLSIVVVCLALCGCSYFQRHAFIKAGAATVAGVKDAGKPATLNTTDARESLPIPAGSTVTVTEIPAVAATATAPAQPARRITEFKPSAPTEWQKFDTSVSANTGTVDTSVALKKVEVAERRWLLWTAIACGIAGIVLKSMLPAWPGLSNGLLLAAAVAGASWKLADVPGWIWGAVLCVVALLALGYKRAQWDANGDGIPDVLQKTPAKTL